jgi:hypothetical protein
MIDKKKVKEIKKTLKKNEKVKTGKHTNLIEIKLDYVKDNPIPVGIRIHNDCTIADKVLALIRLMELVSAEAAAEDKTVTSFIVNCMKAYADACESED